MNWIEMKDALNAIEAAVKLAQRRLASTESLLMGIIERCEQEKAKIGDIYHDEDGEES